MAFLWKVVQSKRWTGDTISPDGSRCSLCICPSAWGMIHWSCEVASRSHVFGLIQVPGFRSKKLFNWNNTHKGKVFLQRFWISAVIHLEFIHSFIKFITRVICETSSGSVLESLWLFQVRTAQFQGCDDLPSETDLSWSPEPGLCPQPRCFAVWRGWCASSLHPKDESGVCYSLASHKERKQRPEKAGEQTHLGEAQTWAGGIFVTGADLLPSPCWRISPATPAPTASFHYFLASRKAKVALCPLCNAQLGNPKDVEQK